MKRTCLLLGASLFLASCVESERTPGSLPRDDQGEKTASSEVAASQGRLTARPGDTSRGKNIAPGIYDLGIAKTRDSRIFIPESYRPGVPAPMMLALHGANGGPQGSLNPFMAMAREHGIILVGAASRSNSWDVLHGGYGPDVRIIDATLKKVFATYRLDADRIGVGGFSDGASYALSLGVTNGDLFKKVIAFSPGFMSPGEPHGQPRFFITHGTDDNVLPIDRTSRSIVPQLRHDGYTVRYEEFAGGHTPFPDSLEAGAWFVSP